VTVNSRREKKNVIQIRELDKTVANLKKSRRNCQKAIDEDLEKIKWIDKEMESIRARLNPLTKAFEEKKARRDHLKKQLEVVSAQCTSMMNEMNARVKNTRHMHCSLGAAEATRALEAARKSPNTCFNLKISDGSRLYLAKTAAMKKRLAKMKK